ncbi:hypothetical protein [Paenibacillus sp. OAS669]|uniref:hypothetical protein n=1 Tax=Paenibacillus sp. OAS669 TaxID=2663821 RepID=UPI00178C132A|nr:hypothetical protein [Paenibacillus sp. OAS669]MBE1446141.1 hypothetical protein [Paenibacillus sp. OAS669]
MSTIETLINQSIDIYLRSKVDKQAEINDFEENLKSLKDIINSYYITHKEKEAILYTLIESILCLEQSALCALNGLYSLAMDSLRKVVELIVFGMHFDKNPSDFHNWLAGASEFRFSQKLDSVYSFPEIRHWSNPFNTQLKQDISNIFKSLSQYTHSNPTKWEQNLRDSWQLEFDSGKFTIWNDYLKEVLQCICTLLAIYSPRTINEAYSRIIKPTVFQEIMSNL